MVASERERRVPFSRVRGPRGTQWDNTKISRAIAKPHDYRFVEICGDEKQIQRSGPPRERKLGPEGAPTRP